MKPDLPVPKGLLVKPGLSGPKVLLVRKGLLARPDLPVLRVLPALCWALQIFMP